MALDGVYINPVAPDANAQERYGSPHERAQRDRRAQSEDEGEQRDRLEISDDARASFLVNGMPPDVDFARKAMEKIPPLSRDRFSQILSRIESGYYHLPMVIWRITNRLVHALR